MAPRQTERAALHVLRNCRGNIWQPSQEGVPITEEASETRPVANYPGNEPDNQKVRRDAAESLKNQPQEIQEDEDEFITIQPRQRRRSYSSESSNPQATLKVHTVVVEGMLKNYANEKALSSLIGQLSFQPHNVIALRDGRSLIKSSDADILERLRPLHNMVGNTITMHIVAKKHWNSTQQPSLSYVVRNIEAEIESTDLMEAFTAQQLEVTQTWRITKRKTGIPSSMFRIIIKDEPTLVRLLESGFTFFHRKFRCEPSKLQPSQPSSRARTATASRTNANRGMIHDNSCTDPQELKTIPKEEESAGTTPAEQLVLHTAPTERTIELVQAIRMAAETYLQQPMQPPVTRSTRTDRNNRTKRRTTATQEPSQTSNIYT